MTAPTPSPEALALVNAFGCFEHRDDAIAAARDIDAFVADERRLRLAAEAEIWGHGSEHERQALIQRAEQAETERDAARVEVKALRAAAAAVFREWSKPMPDDLVTPMRELRAALTPRSEEPT